MDPSANQSLQLPSGTRLLERYEVLRPLGAGASGMVYACKDSLLCGWTVALKLFPAELLREHEGFTRLNREVTTLSGIRHPNVAKFYDFVFFDSFVGFTMEYLDGGTLTSLIKRKHPVPIDEIINILLQVSAGVKAIDEAGVVHRDIKPDNILINSDGIAKIADFGVVRPDTNVRHSEEHEEISVVELKDTGLTQEGDVIGTIDYISPEYLAEGFVDTRSDIYSLGVTAYELICGEVPFNDLSLMDFIRTKVKSDPPAPDQMRSDCPLDLSDIVMKMLTRDPDHRYSSAEEVRHELWELRRRLAEENRPQPTPVVAPKRSMDPAGALATKSNAILGWCAEHWTIWAFFLFIFLGGAVFYDWILKNTDFDSDSMRFSIVDV